MSDGLETIIYISGVLMVILCGVGLTVCIWLHTRSVFLSLIVLVIGALYSLASWFIFPAAAFCWLAWRLSENQAVSDMAAEAERKRKEDAKIHEMAVAEYGLTWPSK